MDQQDALPPFPMPDVHRASWDSSPSWSQYHDEGDPLPTKWDDEPPDEIRGFWNGDQLREYALAAVLAERLRCASICRSRYMGDNTREDFEARACAEAILKG